ncbi:hypothetical protein BH09ACT10_BH09ACT10_26170 [soil metagenome]
MPKTPLALVVALLGSLLVAPVITGGSSSATTGTSAWTSSARIAYVQGGDIFVAHPSGTPKVNITANVSSFANTPSISRTGRYVSYKIGLDTWVYDFQSGTHKKITTGGSGPDFSPTADTITFGKVTSSIFDLYTANVDGTGIINRTNEPTTSLNLGPTWGSDGQSLLYTRSHGVRMCKVNQGGFDDLYYSYRLYRLPLGGGSPIQVAGNDSTRIFGGSEGGGVIAYVKGQLPPTGGGGYCSTTPPDSYTLVVNGVDVGPSTASRPSVNPTGDVAYTQGANVMVDPAGAAGPQVLFPGGQPDWGVAFGTPPTDFGPTDLVAKVKGLKAKTSVGKVDTVNASVRNAGKKTARNVELRFATPKGTAYGYVRNPGEGWSCSVTSKRFVKCNVASLKPKALATLTVGLYAAKKRSKKTRLAIKVSSSTKDTKPSNNDDSDYQLIRQAVAPKAPKLTKAKTASGTRLVYKPQDTRTSWDWRPVGDDQKVWVKVDNYRCFPGNSIYDEQGSISATMWGYESKNSRVIRFELTNTLRPVATSGFNFKDLRDTYKSSIPDDSQSFQAKFPKMWTFAPAVNRDFKYQIIGKWKFIRKGLSRNKTYNSEIFYRC